MKTRFRTKVFVGSMAAAAISLLAAALLLSLQIRERQRGAIEKQLVDEARLIADLLSRAPAFPDAAIDREADRLGTLVSGRVTLIDAAGRVVGDSTQSADQLEALENHADRPEIAAARARGAGLSQRYSTTVGTDMLYIAVPSANPSVRYVRLALPLADVGAQLATIRNLTIVALATTIPVALVVAWLLSATVSRRVQAIAAVATRYSAGELSPPSYDYGADELGTVARVLDSSVQELGKRLAELSRDRARMEAILAGMVEGVLVVDGDARVQLVNRAAQQMLHVDASAVGRRYVEVIRQPDVAAQLAAALRGDEGYTRELALARDPTRMFIARSGPVASSGGGGAVLVLHDITDLRRADQIRRDFVANVSHELRTPLTAIRGYVEALLEEPAGAEETERFLQIIARHSGRMERLVNDLLRLARLDARQELLDPGPCDLEQLLTGIVGDLSREIEAKQQRFVVEVAPTARSIAADAAKLHDIVRNLVENAVNYSPERAQVRLGAVREGDQVVITVADSGVGIPPGDLTRVFERFYRVDKSRSRPGGTGLGLAIVKHLVELHGGKVSASNAPTGGAVFTVTLPVAEPPEERT